MQEYSFAYDADSVQFNTTLPFLITQSFPHLVQVEPVVVQVNNLILATKAKLRKFTMIHIGLFVVWVISLPLVFTFVMIPYLFLLFAIIFGFTIYSMFKQASIATELKEEIKATIAQENAKLRDVGAQLEFSSTITGVGRYAREAFNLKLYYGCQITSPPVEQAPLPEKTQQYSQQQVYYTNV